MAVSVQCWALPTCSSMEFHVVPHLGDVSALRKNPLTGNWNSVIVLDLDDLRVLSNPNHSETGSEVCQASMCVCFK